MKRLNMKNILEICLVSFLMGACVLDEEATSKQPDLSANNQELESASDENTLDSITDDKQNQTLDPVDIDPKDMGDIDTMEYTTEETFSLKVGESHLTQQQVTVTFDSVVSDSRCPTQGDVVCIWEGEITIKVLVNIDGKIIETLMTPGDLSPCSPHLASFTHDDFHLVWDSVSPESRRYQDGVQQADYEVKFIVIPPSVDFAPKDCKVPTKIN